MPRPLRPIDDGLIYHVINRGNNRQPVFFNAGDFQAFLDALWDLKGRKPFELYGYCLLSNHFHLLVRPQGDSISRIMQSLLVSHTQRYHKHRRSLGHVWQGRFRAFPIQEDDHLLTVLRYIERNPVRAALVERAEHWPWSSACSTRGIPALDPGPVARPLQWLEYVNQPQTAAEVERLRECLRRGRPLGEEAWRQSTAQRLGLEASLRPRGRPRKQAAEQPSLFDEGDSPE